LGNPDWQQHAEVLFIGIVGTAFIVQILKLAFRRHRPEGDWGKIYRKTDPHSFPSGHSARAGLLLGLGLWIGPSWLTLALFIYTPLMALARIVMGVHYFLDVLAGYGLGLLIGTAWGWIMM
jgi:undecaprenyl-diphosphatase